MIRQPGDPLPTAAPNDGYTYADTYHVAVVEQEVEWWSRFGLPRLAADPESETSSARWLELCGDWRSEVEAAQQSGELPPRDRPSQNMTRRPGKLAWRGIVHAVQPRIRMLRSFDERTHAYLGFALRLLGTIDDEEREFSVGIGKAAQAKHEFSRGEMVSGLCLPVDSPEMETVEFYKVSKLKVVERAPAEPEPGPPWHGAPPDLPTYRGRGHRRLAARTYVTKCTTCIWGCDMAVEMTIDHWNPSVKRYRTETFCYGPKSCRFYSPGPKRKVPGRKGMSYTEEDWIDEEETQHRRPDD